MRKSTSPKPPKRGPRRGDGWQAEKSALTRTAILDAAIECFVKHGYAGTTTAMIADEAGVSRGAMMHHFPSRGAVIKAVVEHLHAKRIGEYSALMKGIDLPDTQLTRAAIKTSVENAWRYVHLSSFVAYHELLMAARTDPELNEVMQRSEKDYESMFLQTVRTVFPHWQKSPVLELANDIVQFTMRGMAMSHLGTRKQARAKRMIEHLTDQLVQLYANASPPRG